MLHFMPDHPVHSQVNGHAKNLQIATAQAAAWPQTQTHHGASHSFVDMSNERDGDGYMQNEAG